MSAELRPLLLVEDYEPTAKAVARLIEPRRPVRIVGSVQEALQALDAGLKPAGAVLDHGLPEGTGLDLVEPLRSRFPGIPIVLLTGIVKHDLIHEAAALGVTYLPKPFEDESLREFLDRVEQFELLGDAPTKAQALLRDLVRGSGLTHRMLEVLVTCLGCETPREAAEKLRISVNTLKSHVREILRRTGFPNLAALAQAILRGTLSA